MFYPWSTFKWRHWPLKSLQETPGRINVVGRLQMIKIGDLIIKGKGLFGIFKVKNLRWKFHKRVPGSDISPMQASSSPWPS